LPDTQIAVLRDGDRAAGLGEVGEIVIRTPFATLGYLSASKADAARFTPNPWREDPADLLYWTGDLGRRERDGTLVILGRKDEQLKIRGVRVAPAEVAGVLNAHPAVQTCFVTGVRQAPTEEPMLVAYVVLRVSAAAAVADLRAFAAERLLPAMIPARFVVLERIPLLPNGKVDRRALAAELLRSAEPAPAPAEAMSATAQRVAEIWHAALHRERVGLDDDFFEIGGHSLLATTVLTRIRQTFDVEVPLRRMFGRPTIRALAGVIDELLARDPGPASGQAAPTVMTAPRSDSRAEWDGALYVRQLQLGPMENFVYLVGPRDGDEAVVVDPAWDVDAIEQAAARDHRRLVAAVVSHSHDDHINGLAELLRRRDLPVYAHRDELAFSPALRELGRAVRAVRAGDEIAVGPARIKLLHTPGHTPGSLCVLCGDALFSGDTAFVRGCGRCDLEGGDPEAMYRSITDVLLKLPDATRLFPGHHYADRVSSTLGDERRENRFFQFADLGAFIAYRMRGGATAAHGTTPRETP
jgi:glyoxylase-like metal-dependent hydrolase (beta-lactamase superfamily II)/acyl carrier protein